MAERPTRAFYERDPRSTLLRNLCMEAIDASETVLAEVDEDGQALGALLDVNSRLSELGIEPEMHTLDPRDPDIAEKRRRLQEDPVLAAEWLGGQVKTAILGTDAFTQALDNGQLAEHDELLGTSEGLALVNLEAVGPNTHSFMRNLALIGALKGFVDYQAGPSVL